MRCGMMVAFLTGVLAMSATATEPQSKYDLRITYKVFKDGKESSSKSDVKAYKREAKNGATFFHVAIGSIMSVKVEKGDQIIDPDGVVWEVEKAAKSLAEGQWSCQVKKVEPKKPD